MSRFQFEGDFKRKPEQKLGGRSKIETRDAIILKAQSERYKRERDRLRAAAVLQIQAGTRSYLCRKHFKNEWRKEFDAILKTELTLEGVGEQLKRINLFYDFKVDNDRLHELGKEILKLVNREKILSVLPKEVVWQLRMKKFMKINLLGVNNNRVLSRTFIRLIEVFTDVNHPTLAVNAPSDRINFVPELWTELVVCHGFYQKWRLLMETQLELNRDYIANPHPFADSLVTVLQKPLVLAKFLIESPNFGIRVNNRILNSRDVANLLMNQFITSFSSPTFLCTDPKVQLFLNFVVPKLKPNFPHQLLIDNLAKHEISENQRHVFFTALSLLSEYVPTLSVESAELESFINIVQQYVQYIDTSNKYATPAIRQDANMDDTDDEQDEIYMQVDEDNTESIQILEKLRTLFNSCRDLENFFTINNNNHWVRYCPIISRILRDYRNRENLGPFGVFAQFNFLRNLSFRKDFVRNALYRLLRLGVTSSDELAAFCWMFLNSTTALHDTEFQTESPLKISDVQELVNFLKKYYADAIFNDRNENDKSQVFVNKTVVKVLMGLHERNTRLTIIPEQVFCSQESTNLPLESHQIRFEDFDSSEGFERFSLMETRLMRILTEFPFLLSFHNRVSVTQRLITNDRTQRLPYDFNAHHIQIRRNFIYEDAFEKLSVENVPEMRGNVRISLVNVVGVIEAGVDGGGLLREFLTEATKAGVDPNRGLFRLDTQNRLYPNPIAKHIVPQYKKHFELIGRLVGKALYEQTLLELPLAAFFLESCITGHVSGAVDYLATLDPALHKNLLALKNYNDEEFNSLGLDFTLTIDRLGDAHTVDLKPNGPSISVRKENVIEYIHQVADYKINRETAEMCRYFRDGLVSVCPIPRLFTWRELQTLISGSDKPIDVEDWKSHTNYTGGYDASHPMIMHFWEVVKGFEEKNLRKLLKFVTSCSRPPLLGFKDLVPNFGIQSAGQTDRLPSAATCMNLLKLPEYNNPLILREKLIYAIEAQAGFELS